MASLGLALLGLGPLTSGLRAQSAPPAPAASAIEAEAPPRTFPPAEQRALEQTDRGHPREAITTYLGLLEEMMSSAAGTARRAARAEYYATAAVALGRRTGDCARVDAALAERLSSPFVAAHPGLRDVLTELRMTCAEALGQTDTVLGLTTQLGFCQDWQIVGPFDNERGAGFGTRLEPEQKLDLEAVYRGKKRPVRWRRLMRSLPGGRVDLDAMLRPNDQVLAYAATAILTEAGRDALLWLGSDEAVQVWLNGEQLLSRDVRRRFRRDQDAIVLPLRAGANLLLLKVCEQEGGFAFGARVTALDRSPLPGLRFDASADGIRAAVAQTPAPSTDPAAALPTAPYLGARTLFHHSARQDGDPIDAFRLAMLLGFRQPDDPKDRRDAAWIGRAASSLPNHAGLRYRQGRALRRTDRTRAEERDDNAQRAEYEAAVRLDPQHVAAMVALARIELDGLSAPIRAEQRLRAALALRPAHPDAIDLLVRSLDDQGLDPLAAQASRSAVVAAGAKLDTLDVRSLGTAIEHELDARSTRLRWVLPLLAQHVRRADTPRMRRVLAETQAQLVDREAALATMQAAIARFPFDRALRFELVGMHEGTGNYDAALQALGQWLEVCPEDDGAHVRRARLLGLLDKRDSQLEALRTAVELNPNLERQTRYLEFLQADETPFFAGYELDSDAIIEADRGPPADAKDANDPIFHLFQQQVVHAYRNGTTSVYTHRILRILNETGAQRFDRHYVQHYWGEQRARLLEARVVKADGKTIRPRLRGSYVEFPPLAKGDTLILRERVDDTRPSFFGDYFGLVHSFVPDDSAPCNRSELVLVLEPGRDYRLQSTNGAPEPTSSKDDQGNRVERYAMTGLARGVVEERQPSYEEYEPLVRVSTFRDWNHFSSWWWNLIRRQIEVTPAMRTKVAELCAGKATELEKIRAIYDFVTTEIRYTAWEFGVHGYQPYSTPVIFERRHGDCKDKALLLGAMLGEVGIEAWPVLIQADDPRSADDLTVAAVEHFNHCISYVPAKGDRPAMFLDGTATYHPVDTVPTMDQGARVLVVRGTGGALETIDWVAADANVDARTIDVELTATGDATIRLTEAPRRNQAIGLRELLGNETGKVRESLERRYTRGFGKVELSNYEHSNVKDLSAPVRLDATLKASQFTELQDGRLALRGALLTSSFLGAAQADQRELAMLLGAPRSTQRTIRYRLPAGFAPLDLPAPVELEAPFAQYRLAWNRAADGAVIAERVLRWKINRIEPPEYSEFKEFVQRIEAADRSSVFAKREEKR